MDSLAILERGHLFATPSANLGMMAECPFCVARHRPAFMQDEQGLVMSGFGAGERITLCSGDREYDVGLFSIDGRNGMVRLDRDHTLLLPRSMITVPFFLPALSVRRAFIIDEVAVWFCNQALCGDGFHWDDDFVVEVARTCWWKRVPITSDELVRVFLAHGLATDMQSKLRNLFDFAIKSMVAANRRPAIKKLRTEITVADYLWRFWQSAS